MGFLIDKYLLSTCLFIIDEFNERYKYLNTKDELKEIADTEFSEADLVVRLGYPFRQMANFNMQGTDRDIVVKSKDFVIEVKYLRNWENKTSKNRNRSNKILWEDAFEKDYSWLCKEIMSGKKGHRAFVLGWFNAVSRFSELMQLGQGGGHSPEINETRLKLFPFLNYNPETKKTKDIFYMYSKAYTPLSVPILGYEKDTVDCMFLGQENDKFHFSIYW